MHIRDTKECGKYQSSIQSANILLIYMHLHGSVYSDAYMTGYKQWARSKRKVLYLYRHRHRYDVYLFRKDNLELIRYMYPLEIDMTDAHGPLQIAAKYGHLHIVHYLIRRYPNLDLDQAIFYASLGGHLRIIKYLVSLGANIHNCRINCVDNCRHLGKYLIKNGVNVYTDVLTCACIGGYQRLCKFTIQQLIKHGGDINILLDHFDRTILDYAAINGRFKLVRFLVKNGANITLNNNSAIKHACHNKHWKIAQFLLKCHMKNVA